MFTFGSLKRLMFSDSTHKASATLSFPAAGTVAASVRARIGRTVVTLASTRRTLTRAGRLRLTFTMSAANARLLQRTLARRASHRTSGILRGTFDPKGGSKRTRNKSLAIMMR